MSSVCPELSCKLSIGFKQSQRRPQVGPYSALSTKKALVWAWGLLCDCENRWTVCSSSPVCVQYSCSVLVVLVAAWHGPHQRWTTCSWSDWTLLPLRLSGEYRRGNSDWHTIFTLSTHYLHYLNTIYTLYTINTTLYALSTQYLQYPASNSYTLSAHGTVGGVLRMTTHVQLHDDFPTNIGMRLYLGLFMCLWMWQLPVRHGTVYTGE